MKFTIIIFLNFMLLGCLSNRSEMSNFTINEFQKVIPRCDFRSQCKVVDLSYQTCGFYDPIVYSIKTINGENETAFLKLTSANFEKSKKRSGLVEECNGPGKPPPIGVCNRNRCEIIYKWRN